MITVPVYNREGKSVGETNLSDELFGVPAKPQLIQQAVVAQFANRRKPIAHTKIRSEVRGGGKKPWRQKGTGRARHGSIRSPLWKGGGITFGPRNTRNFSVQMNSKAKQKALRMVLSEKAAAKRLILVDALTLEEAKTKALVRMLRQLPLGSAKELSVLTVTSSSSPNLVRASRNLAGVTTIRADSLNVVELLKHEYIVMPQDALAIIATTYGKTARKKAA